MHELHAKAIYYTFINMKAPNLWFVNILNKCLLIDPVALCPQWLVANGTSQSLTPAENPLSHE